MWRKDEGTWELAKVKIEKREHIEMCTTTEVPPKYTEHSRVVCYLFILTIVCRFVCVRVRTRVTLLRGIVQL